MVVKKDIKKKRFAAGIAEHGGGYNFFLTAGWFIVVLVCLFVLGGCSIYKDEPLPEITYVPRPAVVVTEIIKPVSDFDPVLYVPQGWIPPRHIERKWTAVIVHHSATKNGNSAIFDKYHKEGHHWDGIGYDFVIGNGTDSSDGCVEVTYRWQQQKRGAHCGGTANNWANETGVGICLVGDFNNTRPTERQLASLAKLVNFLQKRYKIGSGRVYGHRNTPGARATDCPGKNFLFDDLQRRVARYK